MVKKRLGELVSDSASAVMGTLRYSWLATAFCVLCIVFSPVLFLWLGDIGAHIGRGRPTSRWFSGYAAAVAATGSGGKPPRGTAAGWFNAFRPSPGKAGCPG